MTLSSEQTLQRRLLIHGPFVMVAELRKNFEQWTSGVTGEEYYDKAGRFGGPQV